MTRAVPSLTDAVACLLGPIMAEMAVIIEDGDPDAPLVVELYGRRVELTLGVLQALDLAHHAAFERNQKSACRRRDRKAAGGLFP